MSDEGSSPDSDNSADTTYAAQFRKHLTSVRAHLAGVDGEDLLPSYIPPTGYWTFAEKNTFFHSLSIHSRFRPDLIAASIGTKTVVDVCAYIDTLDEALSRDRYLLSQRSDLEGAMEVSNAWVRWEEKMAEELILHEPKWERNILLLQREVEISTRKVPRVAPIEGDASLEDPGIWEHDRRKNWSREDTLHQLDWHHLTIMDGILNGAEFGDLDVEDASPEDQELHGSTSHFPPPTAQSSGRTPCSSVVGDAMIDPVLLRLSGLPVPDQVSPKRRSPKQHLGLLSAVDSPHNLPPPSNAVSLPLSQSAPVPLQPSCHARTRNPSPEDDQGIDSSGLGPASRRRFQKRLYMRRKRAAQKGEKAIAVVEKLRPGRKVKQRKAPKLGGQFCATEPSPLYFDGSEDALMDVDQNAAAPVLATNAATLEKQQGEKGDGVNEDGNGSDVAEYRRPIQGGMTKPYKIKREFASKGIDADALKDGGLGFFHLSTLGRLMRLYKSGYDTKGSEAGTSISADTIQLMTAILVEFTTEVVQRAITSRDQENKMKGEIKAYRRIRNEISVKNLKHVLEMMGMNGLTKEKYFAQLLGDDMPETSETEDDEDLPPSDEDSGDDDEASEEASSDDGDGENDPTRLERPIVFPALLPLHRECHPPFVHLPKSLAPRPQGGSRGITAVAIDEPLMLENTDEEELLEELEAEMGLDAVDNVIAHEYEASLWERFGKRIPKEIQ